jgi:type II secretory pathway component PulJ
MTLIEMMVALLILSLMSVIIIGSFRGGLFIWERQEVENRSLDRARVLMARLASQVRSAYPWIYEDEGESGLYFRGDAGSMEFTSLVGFTSSRENGMIHALRYALTDDAQGEGKQVLVEEYGWPRRGFPDGEMPLVSEALGDVEEFRLRYKVGTIKAARGRRAAGDAEEPETLEWRDNWSGGEMTRQKRPSDFLAAVEVTLAVKPENGEKQELSTVIPVLNNWKDILKK